MIDAGREEERDREKVGRFERRREVSNLIREGKK
jgi:hypothetical protein